MNWFPDYHFILASKSPRRQQLLRSLGVDFQVRTVQVNEEYPPDLTEEEIPVYLARVKAHPFVHELKNNDLLITADTIVWHKGKALGKPVSEEKASEMLFQLSGDEHKVISGVCLSSAKKQKVFFSVSSVQFKTLTSAEIDYYVSVFKPFDKAGAYGIQEWIGFVGITHLEGSFYNVMGLPIQKLYEEIVNF
jgi:septum formation protein